MSALLLLAAATAPLPELTAFNRLLGKCFAGEVAEGIADTHCFEPVYGGEHVRDRHQVVAGGQIVYEGETLYSLEDRELTFTYWNSAGGIGRGVALPFDNGICFEGSMRANPDDEPQAIASCWRWDGADYTAIDGEGSVRFRAGAEKF